ncbi:hypothetical protein LTR37_019803 [Vermiconidia calcicola]|uniref:Uncharacterized protein n=1 Tax=Vermiconidia calcicola TaxID=1690605 RepID=A0ACC3MD45_9PEZI|nr:hypothetical protein LTR37_019803 [Vermiconidia calcicola]
MSRQRFSDQVVFVTGGSSGLGADTCELFIQEGAKVFVTDILERDIIKRLGADNACFHTCDVSNPEDCESAIKACVEKYGRLDVLFHNGARLPPLGDVVQHDVKAFQDIISTNLNGLFYLSRVAIPQMREQGKGNIIATASISGLGGDYGLSSYNAAKGGTVNLVRSMAIQHAKEGIRINSVCPGYMLTPMTQAMQDSAELGEEFKKVIPMGRGADPKEIGRAVLFLASDDASYITGHALTVDGGTMAHTGFPQYMNFLGSG